MRHQKPKTKAKSLKKTARFSTRQLIVFALLFGIAGGYGLWHSLAAPASGSFPLDPYTSKANQIDKFASGVSIYSQPWRGYFETVPAQKLLNGMGVVYTLDDKTDPDAAIKLLNSSGIHSLRKEVGWGSLNDAETDLLPDKKTQLLAIVNAAKKYGVTPVILINANDGHPEPLAFTNLSLAVAAPAGSRSITISGSQAGLVAKHSGFDALNQFGAAAGALFTAITPSGGNTVVTLSRPTTKDMPAGTTLKVTTLKHLPLYPVGTPEFDDTAGAWVNYAKVVADTVASTGIGQFDVEIWNELTFGSDFLNINKYYDPALTTTWPSNFRPGGAAWEMANRSTKALKDKYGAKLNVIWGFSNTTYYETKIDQLPPHTDGESFHPYHTSPMTLADIWVKLTHFLGADGKPTTFIPSLTLAMPEGRNATGIRPEQLLRGKMAPWVRSSVLPPGTSSFKFYFTEHGVNPEHAGITDPAAAHTYRSKALLRMYAYWLNKGLDKLDVFAAYKNTDIGMGIMNSANPLTPSTELNTLKNMTNQLAGNTAIASPRQLGAEVTATGPQYEVFPASGANPALEYRDLFTLLPFQVNDHKFVLADYVLTENLSKTLSPMTFEVTIKNIAGSTAALSYYDPLTGASQPINVLARDASSVRVGVTAVDYPRLIVVDEGNGGPPPVTPPPPGTPPPPPPPPGGPPPAPPPIPDTISITQPADKSVVSKQVTIKTTTSGSDIAKVQFLVDKTLLGSSTSSPYQAIWDSTKFKNGHHTITVKALDKNGAVQASAAVTVKVKNAKSIWHRFTDSFKSD